MTENEIRRMTLAAVELCVIKWHDVIGSLRTQEKGARDCALCVVYTKLLPTIGIGALGACNECPIAARTGVSCSGSPYAEWVAHMKEHYKDGDRRSYVRIGCSTCEQIANEEIRFLTDLYFELKDELSRATRSPRSAKQEK